MSESLKTPDPSGKIFAVGDIHGSADTLRRLLAGLPVNPMTDTLVFLGDYINRGTDSKGVIKTLLALRERVPRTVFLLGNHEHCLLQYARTRDPQCLHLLREMGVEATLRSYGSATVRSLRDLSFLPEEHGRFLNELRPFHRQGPFIFVHAGLLSGEPPEASTLETLTEIRGLFLTQDAPSRDHVVVFGHTPFETPFVRDGKIGIDTGAVYGNMLTAVALPTMRFYHARG